MLRGSTMWRRIDPSACRRALLLLCFRVCESSVGVCEYKGNPGPGQGPPGRLCGGRHPCFGQGSDSGASLWMRLGGTRVPGRTLECSTGVPDCHLVSHVPGAGDRTCLGWQGKLLASARAFSHIGCPGPWSVRVCEPPFSDRTSFEVPCGAGGCGRSLTKRDPVAYDRTSLGGPGISGTLTSHGVSVSVPISCNVCSQPSLCEPFACDRTCLGRHSTTRSS